MKEGMEKLKSPAASPFKGNDIDIAALAGKLKHVALNTPLWFSTQAWRPHSKSTARFGSLSHHSFFSRHNPHPHRVTHIQGLNGAPVCTVKDEWSVQTSPPLHPMIKSQFRTAAFGMLAIQMPIGDPLPIPVPTLTIGSLSEAWREELRELAARVRAAPSTGTEKKQTTENSQRETQYSEETGRLIPLTSRATTRHSSHCPRKNNAQNKGKDAILSFQGQELMILELLCQILQTDSLMAIQQWLLTASQKEKNIVMGLLQIATANLQLEPRELITSTEERLVSWKFADGSKLPSPGRNHSTRLSVIRHKQEPTTEEEKPAQLGSAEVFQLHLCLAEKQNQPDQLK